MGQCGWCHEKIAESVLVQGLCTICLSRGCNRVKTKAPLPDGRIIDAWFYNPPTDRHLDAIYVSAEAIEDIKSWGCEV